MTLREFVSSSLRPAARLGAVLLAAVAATSLLPGGIPASRAQLPGQVDPTFNPGVFITSNTETSTGFRFQGADSGPGFSSIFLPAQNNFTTFAIALQPQFENGNFIDYRLIIAGDGAVFSRLLLNSTTITTGSGDTALTRTLDPGVLDPTFNGSPSVPLGFGAPLFRIIYAIAPLEDGRLIIGGNFFKPNPNPGGSTLLQGSRIKQLNIGRVQPNGGTATSRDIAGNENDLKPVDTDPFNINIQAKGGADGPVISLLRRSTGDRRILVGGQFENFNGVNQSRLVQLLDDGTLDTAFNNNLGKGGADGTVFSIAEDFDPATGLPNGRVYVCGTFQQIGSTKVSKVARLNEDGTLDGSFSARFDERPLAIAVQTDGKVLVGGDFRNVNGVGRFNLARLNPDGSLDATFLDTAGVRESNPAGIPPTAVYAIKVQPDGRILIGGNFLKLNGEPRLYLGRLLANGAIDTTFVPSPAVDLDRPPAQSIANAVQQIALVPDVFVPNAATGLLPDIIVSTTRPDKKAVPGDKGFYPGSVQRVLNDQTFTSATLGPFFSSLAPTHPAFFNGEIPLGNGFYFLRFPATNNLFGYYNYAFFPVLYHVDLGFVYFQDANDGANGAYLYDFASNSWFYTSPTFPFPYLYDFSLNALLYYFPQAGTTDRYTSDPRYFYNFSTGQIITK